MGYLDKGRAIKEAYELTNQSVIQETSQLLSSRCGKKTKKSRKNKGNTDSLNEGSLSNNVPIVEGEEPLPSDSQIVGMNGISV